MSTASDNATPRDWFIAAIEKDGTIGACLDAVITELDARAAFVKMVKNRLGGNSSLGIDAITEISQRIKSMENTLRFRLGMLQADRPGAWFRAPVAQTVGPFSSALIAEPVFSEYSDLPAAEVRKTLLLRWTEARTNSLPFKSSGICLWRTMLVMNEDLERTNQLSEPWNELRLDLLPDRLPANLESRSLRAFLGNVRTEYFAVRERLDACYKLLRDASENLWELQIRSETEKAVRDERLKAESERARRPWNESAGDLREEFRKRRQSAQRERARDARSAMGTTSSATDFEALKCMGFEVYPTPDTLRQRYLLLAKTYHPDRGGSEDKFKSLTRAYKQLSDRIR